MNRNIIILFVLLFSSIQDVYSQACCSSGTPLSAQIGMEFLDSKNAVFSIAYDFNNLHTIFSGSEKLKSDERARLSHNVIFRFQYAFSNKLSLGFSLPYVFRSEINTESFSSFSSLESSGLGDVLLQINYALKRSGMTNILVSSAIKIPSGSNEEVNEFGFTLPSDLQPGTGSWDFIFAGLTEINSIWGGHVNFNASLSARFNGEGSRFEAKQSYQFGNAFQLISGLNYEFMFKKNYLIPSVNISYRRTLRDLTNGALTPNTGGDWVNIVPGISLYSTNFKFLFSSAIPIFRYLEGTQLTTSYQFYFQIEYTIKSKVYGPKNI